MTQGPPGGYNPPPGGYGGPPPGGYGGPPPGGYGGPPGGYGAPPQGGYGGAPGYGGPPAPYGGFPPPGPLAPGGGPANLAALTHREPVTVLLLSIVTCGVYFLIWKYQTTEELRQASGDNSINPMLDIVLTVVLCGLWGVYADYRNAKKLFELAQAAGMQRSDQSTIVLVLDLVGLAFVSTFILQGEYNALAQAAQGRQLPR
ncbi:MAG TPA: DUF4234 domain-containing protein [Polyangiaceae bacterium]|nr:DUF4234 domain-containing protein [Polyangiaceae bacterium]